MTNRFFSRLKRGQVSSFRKALVLLLAISATGVQAQDAEGYKEPPTSIKEMLMAPSLPGVNFNKAGTHLLLLYRNEFPTVEDLAQPEMRIAGIRWNPRNAGPSRTTGIGTIKIKEVQSGLEMDITGLPANLRASDISWNQSENAFALVHTELDHQDLYMVQLADRKAVKINTRPLNTVTGSAYSWVGDETIVYKGIPEDAGKMPNPPNAPSGPVVQATAGKSGASRTYQDLIKSPYDEQVFEWFARVQLIKFEKGQEVKIGDPMLVRSFNASPDGKWIMVQEMQKPFSYLVPYSGFPHRVLLLSLSSPQTGKSAILRELANNPSSEGNPIGFDAAPTYPRNYAWRADEPATITFVKALDNGTGKGNVPFRDAFYTINIHQEVNAKPVELFKTKYRFGGILWGTPQLAIVSERNAATRIMRTHFFNPTTGQLDSMYQRRMDDAYADMGSPVTAPNQFGRNVLVQLKNGDLLLESSGASPEGNMPFIARYSIKTRKSTVLWRCEAPYYENPVAILDYEKMIFITSRESLNEAPNYFLRDLRKKTMAPKPLTQFQHPYPMLSGIKKEKVRYKRADGIDLTGDLYLPAGFQPGVDKPLPIIMWAYPREYKSADDAAQVRGSKYTFTRIGYGSPIYWVTQGYAVLDNAEMPIVGEKGKEPNDNFVAQLELNAKAALMYLHQLKVGDTARAAVGGHSYGAFMTANLLAHTKLFKAGIARSGAYNRTLTPFGFQNEERTFWQAPELYSAMSPFNYADKIKTPILLIHGEADNNPGTFPIQSERLFNAIKGHGGTARLVFLPFESHGYAAKENILHMLWEQHNWLETHVKKSTAP
jgi:dipeptidyl aminopeptidase/acylaminoacyl peptidase